MTNFKHMNKIKKINVSGSNFIVRFFVHMLYPNSFDVQYLAYTPHDTKGTEIPPWW